MKPSIGVIAIAILGALILTVFFFKLAKLMFYAAIMLMFGLFKGFFFFSILAVLLLVIFVSLGRREDTKDQK